MVFQIDRNTHILTAMKAIQTRLRTLETITGSSIVTIKMNTEWDTVMK